jgi:mannose-6-phosphate isomerase-like protein (cupin superfamily)
MGMPERRFRLPQFHHRPLPEFSTLLSGRQPPDEVGFQSERLQIWYNHTNEGWSDRQTHAHRDSDECFIVLRGSLEIEVEGERYTIGPREFCCFPAGVYHRIVSVETPAETLMVRAPSVDDKVYLPDQSPSTT